MATPGPLRRIVRPPLADRGTVVLLGSFPLTDVGQRFRSAPHHDRVEPIGRAVSLDGGNLDHNVCEPNRPLAEGSLSWRVAADAARA